jgi:hypothetical protein
MEIKTMAPKRKPTNSRKTPSSKSVPNTKRLAQSSKLVPKAKASAPRQVSRVAPKADTSFAGLISARRKELQGTNVFVLNIPYEAQFFSKSLGVEYNTPLRSYIYEGLRLPVQLEPYRSEDFSFERWVEDELNGKVSPIEGANASMKPRPHQVKAIRKIEASAKAGWRGFILADNVGIGKTVEAVFGAYVTAKIKGFTPQNKAKLLIVAPKSVLPHWRNTIKATGVNNLRVVVINYDQAKKLLDSPASASQVKKNVTANRHTMLNGRPNIGWDIIIADEAHKLKNESQRTAAFNNIARYSASAEKAPFTIWASATVGQNPLEVGYLAPIIAQICGFKSLSVEQYGDWLITNKFNVKKSKAGNFSWIKPKPDTTNADREFVLNQQRKDVQRISELLFSPTAPSIRRNPEEIAGWPSQTYAATPLQLSSEGHRLYAEAWNEFRRYIGLNPRGKNPKGGLAATLRFRQKASMLSALSTAEFANDLLDNGIQVAISVEFIETLDTIKDYLEKKGWHCAEFSGRNTNDRENERIRFQKGEAQVMLFTVKEGISLHAGEQLADGTNATAVKRSLVVHDIRYSAIDMTQIVGRTTRDGQLAMAYLMYTEETIEPKILQTVLERMKNVRTLSGDDEGTLEIVQDILDGI